MVERLAAPAERARVRLDEPADDVEERRLPGAVGTDDPEHLAPVDLDRNGVERGDPAERHRHVANHQIRAGVWLPLHAPRTLAQRSPPANSRHEPLRVLNRGAGVRGRTLLLVQVGPEALQLFVVNGVGVLWSGERAASDLRGVLRDARNHLRLDLGEALGEARRVAVVDAE